MNLNPELLDILVTIVLITNIFNIFLIVDYYLKYSIYENIDLFKKYFKKLSFITTFFVILYMVLSAISTLFIFSLIGLSLILKNTFSFFQKKVSF
jgi:hypothetical protein